MSRIYTRKELIARVPGLTGPRLVRFIEAEIVTPVQRTPEPVFHPIDLARLELACELADQFDLNADALGLVLSLVDQLHGVRGELHALMRAVAAQPAEIRARIGAALQEARARE